MRLTMFTDYALRTLILAASKQNANVTIEEAAGLYGISTSHLKKVVRTLTNGGLLQAQRGRSGGFRLALRPEEINLGAVIRLTEADFGIVECFRPENQCLISRACRLPPIINRALQAMFGVFDQYTLADLMIGDDLFGGPGPLARPEGQPLRGPRLTPSHKAPG